MHGRTVTIPESTAEVRSAHRFHAVGIDGKDRDISSLRIVDPPPYLTGAHIRIGDGSTIPLGEGDVRAGRNLLPSDADPFPTSRTPLVRVELVLEYDVEHLASNEVKALVDEMEEREELSDEEVEFFDGYEYSRGRRVTRTKVPTGRRVEQVVEYAQVAVPAVELVEVTPTETRGPSTLFPFWEDVRLRLENQGEVDHLRRLFATRELRDASGATLSPDSIEKSIVRRETFVGKAKNYIRFCNGLASKVFVF